MATHKEQVPSIIGGLDLGIPSQQVPEAVKGLEKEPHPCAAYFVDKLKKRYTEEWGEDLGKDTGIKVDFEQRSKGINSELKGITTLLMAGLGENVDGRMLNIAQKIAGLLYPQDDPNLRLTRKDVRKWRESEGNRGRLLKDNPDYTFLFEEGEGAFLVVALEKGIGANQIEEKEKEVQEGQKVLFRQLIEEELHITLQGAVGLPEYSYREELYKVRDQLPKEFVDKINILSLYGFVTASDISKIISGGASVELWGKVVELFDTKKIHAKVFAELGFCDSGEDYYKKVLYVPPNLFDADSFSVFSPFQLLDEAIKDLEISDELIHEALSLLVSENKTGTNLFAYLCLISDFSKLSDSLKSFFNEKGAETLGKKLSPVRGVCNCLCQEAVGVLTGSFINHGDGERSPDGKYHTQLTKDSLIEYRNNQGPGDGAPDVLGFCVGIGHNGDIVYFVTNKYLYNPQGRGILVPCENMGGVYTVPKSSIGRDRWFVRAFPGWAYEGIGPLFYSLVLLQKEWNIVPEERKIKLVNGRD